MKKAVILTMFVLLLAGTGCKKQEAEFKTPVEAGRELFKIKCFSCHKTDKSGGKKKGPNLSNVGAKKDQAWLRDFLADPSSVKPDSKMSKVPLTPKEIDQLTAYLSTLKD